MRTLIENSGYRVHCASSAAEAFRVLETKYVDAGLLDIQMPGYSGAELAKAIRAYAGTRYSPSMPLFAMTAQDCSSMGRLEELFAIVFPKPTDIGKFSAALNEAMIERETMVMGGQALSERLNGNAAVMDKMRINVESAIAALSLALAGTSDATIDIKAQAAVLSSAFMRIPCVTGQEMVRLFLEHYTDEDKSVLAGLLDRVARMLDTALAIHGVDGMEWNDNESPRC
jgi:CheY-like chemotaxis protein